MKEFIVKAFANNVIKALDECNQKELIRCKDCKNCGIDSTSHPQYWCSAHSEYHDGDWFCADGEHA